MRERIPFPPPNFCSSPSRHALSTHSKRHSTQLRHKEKKSLFYGSVLCSWPLDLFTHSNPCIRFPPHTYTQREERTRSRCRHAHPTDRSLSSTLNTFIIATIWILGSFPLFLHFFLKLAQVHSNQGTHACTHPEYLSRVLCLLDPRLQIPNQHLYLSIHPSLHPSLHMSLWQVIVYFFLIQTTTNTMRTYLPTLLPLPQHPQTHAIPNIKVKWNSFLGLFFFFVYCAIECTFLAFPASLYFPFFLFLFLLRVSPPMSHRCIVSFFSLSSLLASKQIRLSWMAFGH